MKVNWLAQLAPAHMPPPVGWWPPAVGWWALAFLFFLVLVALGAWIFHPRLRLRRRALRELKEIESASKEDSLLAQDVESLMRRYALARFGRDSVARLTGEKWLAFIVARGGRELAGDAGRSFLRLAYGGSATGQASAWLVAARGFIKGPGRGGV